MIRNGKHSKSFGDMISPTSSITQESMGKAKSYECLPCWRSRIICTSIATTGLMYRGITTTEIGDIHWASRPRIKHESLVTYFSSFCFYWYYSRAKAHIQTPTVRLKPSISSYYLLLSELHKKRLEWIRALIFIYIRSKSVSIAESLLIFLHNEHILSAYRRELSSHQVEGIGGRNTTFCCKVNFPKESFISTSFSSVSKFCYFVVALPVKPSLVIEPYS
jgi:hypothetical protein